MRSPRIKGGRRLFTSVIRSEKTTTAFLAFLLFLIPVQLFATNVTQSCMEDKPRQELRSKELQEIVAADQSERTDWNSKTPEERDLVTARDTKRRERVGQIFGEGCFAKAEDYAAAALVFQHGNTPDHFFQTFIWAKRAVELGDVKQKELQAWGLDRYLVNIGHKQLFASQFIKMNSEPCWHLDDYETTFPDKLRKQYTGKTLADAIARLKEMNVGQKCDVVVSTKLKPTPRGTIPGFW